MEEMCTCCRDEGQRFSVNEFVLIHLHTKTQRNSSNMEHLKSDRLKDINENCLLEFRRHWLCLENNNQQLWHCRRPEQLLNRCVFDKLVREYFFFLSLFCPFSFSPCSPFSPPFVIEKRNPLAHRDLLLLSSS